jgi:transcription termination factor Rho
MTTITHEQPVAAANKKPAAAANNKPATPADKPAAAANNKPATAPPPTTADNSALVSVSGILDIGDGRAFVRTSGYRMGRDDVYVSADQVRQYGLRQGDQIAGAARQAGQRQAGQRQAGQGQAGQGQAGQGDAGQGGGDRNGRRSKTSAAAKHPALVRIDAINGLEPERSKARPDFDELTPLYPQERLRLESGSPSPVARIIDLVSPIGKGQRGLIVSAPKVGKTLVLKEIAAAVAAGNPEVHLMVVLVGERPEEVTDLRRTVNGEVIFSTFDQSASDHIMVAELAIERAKRLVELGKDVVVLLDSITRLGRAYNLAAPASSRILAGGVATSALQPPRRFLGAARNIEEGGSLTILCSALIDTGSRMDDVFFEEFKGTGNMELRLRRELAEKRLFPAVDVASSGTRRDDLLMPPQELAAADSLRRALAGLDPQQALELLLDKTRDTASNAEFLLQVQRSTPNARLAASA